MRRRALFQVWRGGVGAEEGLFSGLVLVLVLVLALVITSPSN